MIDLIYSMNRFDSSPRFRPHRRADFSCIRAIFLYSPLFLYHQFPCIRGKKEKLRKRKPSLHSDASSKNKGTKRYWIKDTISIKKVRRSIKIHSRTVPKKGSDRKGRERDLLGLREGADRGGVLFREKRISMSGRIKIRAGKVKFFRGGRGIYSFIRR